MRSSGNLRTVMLLGPLAPPYIGPAIATEMIVNSKLKERFNLIHLNTNTHQTVNSLGRLALGNLSKNMVLYLKMVRLLFRNRPELVLIPVSQTTRGFLKDSIFILISWFFGVKIILQLRGSNFRNWLSQSSRLVNRYVKKVLNMTQGMIVLGKKLKELFLDYYSPEKIFVVPNGADYNYSVESQKQNGEIRIVYLGSIKASKGIGDIVDAIACMKKELHTADFELQIAGQWSPVSEWATAQRFKEDVLNVIKKNRLPVTFAGELVGEAKWALLSSADIFVFTPREPEGHPWVIIEAMAAGLPIISTDKGAITESVIDGVNGFIVDAGSPKQIAEKLNMLIENRDLREQMGKKSKDVYLEKFTESKMVDNLSRAFLSVIED